MIKQFYFKYWSYWSLLVRLTHGQGHQIAQKRQGLPGAEIPDILYGRVRRAVNGVLLVFDDFLKNVVGTACWQIMWRLLWTWVQLRYCELKSGLSRRKWT